MIFWFGLTRCIGRRLRNAAAVLLERVVTGTTAFSAENSRAAARGCAHLALGLCPGVSPRGHEQPPPGLGAGGSFPRNRLCPLGAGIVGVLVATSFKATVRSPGFAGANPRRPVRRSAQATGQTGTAPLSLRSPALFASGQPGCLLYLRRTFQRDNPSGPEGSRGCARQGAARSRRGFAPPLAGAIASSCARMSRPAGENLTPTRCNWPD
jgi:hypothetical protein